MRDFLLIMKGLNIYQDARWNRTDNIYTFDTGSQIEFFSVDQPDKVRGARRDRLFINEANNVTFDAFEQLEVRTKDFIFLDWNPSSEFWYYTELKDKRNDIEELTLTYLDNEALSDDIVKSIEQRRNRKGWWAVFGEGKLGEVEGKIYKDWKIIDEVPHEARLERYGLDFGYTNDPTAIVALYYYNGGYIVDEITYQKGLSNKQIADILKNEEQIMVIADSAEPKSIDEIRSYGVNITGAKKKKERFGGEQSYLKWSIGLVQEQRISITKRSINIIREYRNYLWEVDKNGRVENTPEKGFDHSLDAIRYAVTTLIPVIQREEFVSAIPIFASKKKSNPAR